MAKNITDRRILKAIYDRYYLDFISFEEDENSRSTKIYVPVDCKQIANDLDIDPEIIFGRLYYHLDKKHGYTQDDGCKVNLFAMKIGDDMHTVHFPLLSAVLAEYEQSYYRYLLPIGISLLAITISVVNFILTY